MSKSDQIAAQWEIVTELRHKKLQVLLDLYDNVVTHKKA
jgi:hypothetical protein